MHNLYIILLDIFYLTICKKTCIKLIIQCKKASMNQAFECLIFITKNINLNLFFNIKKNANILSQTSICFVFYYNIIEGFLFFWSK